MELARAPAAMLARIAQDVAQRVPHLARRAEDVVVIAIGEDAPPAPPQTVERARHPHRKPLDSSRKGRPAAAFDEQVQMIRLHAEVHEPEAPALTARCDRATEDRELPLPPQ
jgi:hypothetical protein